jgi:hypothetical protein
VIDSILNFFRGCRHKHTTWPQSPRRIGSLTRFARKAQASVTCLECGAEFTYDLKTMRRGARIYPEPQHAEAAVVLEQEAR